MSWSIGYDSAWKRDIGYGVPAYCDHPQCFAQIDRGLGHVCGGEPYGGEHGCGLYLCEHHLHYTSRGPLCARCRNHRKSSYPAKEDHPDWVRHKATDPSWAEWRAAQKQEDRKP